MSEVDTSNTCDCGSKYAYSQVEEELACQVLVLGINFYEMVA